MRKFGTPLILDLKAGGASASASVTPTTSVVPTSFSTPNIKQAVGSDNYPLCRGIMTKNVITFDQAASGGAVVNWDELFRCNDSFNVTIPKLGVTHDKNVFTGPIAKHIAEFFALGYRYCDNARAQIAAADGDTTVTLYTFLPFTNETVEDPEAFWIWVGWMRDMELVFSIATATTIAAVSTGAVTKAPCTLTAWLECYISPQPILPAISQWNKYTTNAASGQNLAVLLNVGTGPNGMNAVEAGSRLMAVVELMNVLGFGGCSTGDLFTSFACPELGQDATSNIDGFLTSFKSALGHRGPISGIGTSNAAVHDGAGDLHTMAGAPNGSPFASTLKFIPWRYTSPNGRIEYAPKVNGNINLTRQFTSTPTSGVHLVVTNEVRQLQESKRAELQRDAGVPANTPRGVYSSRPVRPSQTFGHGLVLQTRTR